MAGYLDEYGAGEERRETLTKRVVILAGAILVIGGLSWYIFKNHQQERDGRNFLALLRKRDYASAYGLWGCSVAKPCGGYAYDKFMEDWGPKYTGAGSSTLKIADSESCGSGVILTINVTPSQQEKLWIERNNPTIGFSPFPVCPNKSSFSIMLHRTIGNLRKPFLN